jgi:outer membrane lipoprotein carrier protein
VARGTRPRPAAERRRAGQALQQRYQTIKDFSADFVHTYRGGALRTQTSERGTVKIKKPGKMRWIYTAPERKEFVSDGVKIYSHIPRTARCWCPTCRPTATRARRPVPVGQGRHRAGLHGLAGREPGSRRHRSQAHPKRPEPQYDYFIVATTSRGCRSAAGHPRPPGGRRFRHSLHEPKGKSGHSDNEFAFRIPKGADVITNGGN